jgi:hypothetical protein
VSESLFYENDLGVVVVVVNCYIIKKIQFNLCEGKYIKNLDAICVQVQFGAIL